MCEGGVGRGDNWRLSNKFNPSISKYLIGGYFMSVLCAKHYSLDQRESERGTRRF